VAPLPRTEDRIGGGTRMREEPPKQRSEAAPAACSRARGKTTPVPDTRREDEHADDLRRTRSSEVQPPSVGASPAHQPLRPLLFQRGGTMAAIRAASAGPARDPPLWIRRVRRTARNLQGRAGQPMSSARLWSVPKGTVGGSRWVTAGSVRRLGRVPEVRHARLGGIEGLERSRRDGDRPRRGARIARLIWTRVAAG
jgi:hypothetical protein